MSIYEKLYQFQKNVVDTFKDRDRFGLFLDAGLGKTPTALAFAEVNHCNKVLVITINAKAIEPATEPGSWLDWASQADIKYDFLTKYSTNEAFKITQHLPQLFIVNYESLFVHGKRSNRTGSIMLNAQIDAFIAACKRQDVAIIIDESHKVKNLNSGQTQAISQIAKKIKSCANTLRFYLCTGTPFTTGYIDLYAQLKFLGYDAPKYEFTDNFCIRGRIPGLLEWQQPIVGYKNVDALFKLVHKYAITIMSDDVAVLPEKIFVNISQPQSQAFNMFVKENVSGVAILDFAKSCHIELNEYDKMRFNTISMCSNPFFRNIDYPSLEFFAETAGTAWMRARQL
ncbi:MAG: SNF2-related protein, partial [Acinetobacter sp.]